MQVDHLEIYKLANELSDHTWMMVKSWSGFRKDTLGKQLMCSVDSVSANIAEGSGRQTFRERAQFHVYARGSLLEYRDQLKKAHRRLWISTADYDQALNICEGLYWKLNRYLRYLRQRQSGQRAA